MERKCYFGLAMLVALTTAMVSCSKDIGGSSTENVEITGACAMGWGSVNPSVSEYSSYDLYLFGKGINPNNYLVTGSGEMGTGWLIRMDCCCLNEEIAKLEKGENGKLCYDKIVPGTYTWDGSEELKHLRIFGVYVSLYQDDRRVEWYSTDEGKVTACTVEIKRGHLGERYEATGEISLADGKELSFVWKGGAVEHRYNAQ